MKKIAVVYGGSGHHHRALFEPKMAKWWDTLIYLPDLHKTDLSEFDAVIVPERLHLGMLHKGARRVLDYLNKGGIVLAFGEQPDPFLPNIRWENRPLNFWWWLHGEPSGISVGSPTFSLFKYLQERDVTWHQHGVLIPPDGAESIVVTDDGKSVFYVDTTSTNGTLLVTTLDPMFHFGSHFMPATERFLDGFYPWLHEEFVPHYQKKVVPA